jgi:8-oxo-dGTP pyrophosphatase MutT (NUDIX family)
MQAMNTPRHREIACAILIDTSGRLLLQQRDDVPNIRQPGKIGLFGGHREGNETYLQCVVREISEEISYFVSPDRFEHLASYDGVELEGEDGTVRGEFFIAREIPADTLVVTEGSLLVVEAHGLAAIGLKLAPFARFAIKAFYEKRVTPVSLR